MPNDNIDRAIKKGAGGDNSENFETITYEGYGPNGTAFIVSCLTDNKNRTAADVRHYFSKFGGNLGYTGCVSYLFDRLGIIALDLDESVDEDEVMLEALENGADDVKIEEGIAEIITAPENFSAVNNAYKNADYKILGADISMIPQNEVSVTDEESIKLILKLIDHLEDNDDVQEIYHNCNLPEDAQL